MNLQVIYNGIITGCLYSLVALGFSLIYSGTKVFHIAHGAIYTSAPYFLLGLTRLTALTSDKATGWLLGAEITLSLVSVCFLAIVFELLVYRPLLHRKAPPLASFIASLGLYIVTVNSIAMFFGNETKTLNPHTEPSVQVAGIIITRIQSLQFGVSVSLVLITLFILKNTSLGRNIRALADNPTLLSVLGANIKRIRILVFVIGSLLAASSSLLCAFDVGINPQVGLSAVLTATVAVIIAGVGSNKGVIVVCLLIAIIQNMVVWYASAQWQDAVTYIILTIVLLVRREGLFVIQLRLEER